MATYFRIVDWDKHYEVDDHGHTWKPGKPFRPGPLGFVRVKARGREWSYSSLVLSDLAGIRMYLAVGVFQKLTEIVAGSPRTLRVGGIIRNRKGMPATLLEISAMLRIAQVNDLEEILRLLIHPEVAWLEEISGDTRSSPEIPEDYGALVSLPENAFGGIVGSTDKSSRSQDKEKKSQENTMAEYASPSPELPADSHDLFLQAGFDSTRLGFLRDLRVTLRANTNSDHQTIINFEGWLNEQLARSCRDAGERDQRLTSVMRLARDCQRGDSPMAVFMSRVKGELGYIPPSRKTDALRMP